MNGQVLETVSSTNTSNSSLPKEKALFSQRPSHLSNGSNSDLKLVDQSTIKSENPSPTSEVGSCEKVASLSAIKTKKADLALLPATSAPSNSFPIKSESDSNLISKNFNSGSQSTKEDIHGFSEALPSLALPIVSSTEGKTFLSHSDHCRL